MAKVEGLEKVNKALKDLAKKGEMVSVIVGYTAKYALWVHENLEMKWKGKPRKSGLGVYWGPAGQSKFLEQPARELAGVLGSIVSEAVKKGSSLLQGLYLAGLRLQRESQKRVPVEYSNLKGSAFTRKEK